MGEALAAQREYKEAVKCGQRAAVILVAGPDGTPFVGQELHRREGLLYFTMGHVIAALKQDPLPVWRHAAVALGKYGDLQAEGEVLLQVGLQAAGLPDAAVPPNEPASNFEALEEAVSALEDAADRFNRARGKPEVKMAAKELPKARARCAEFARLELQAQIALATVAANAGDSAGAGILVQSSYLMDLAPRGVSGDLARAWARDCGNFAFVAMKVGRVFEAEQALLKQHRYAQASMSVNLELEALNALAVVRHRLQDRPGLDQTLQSIDKLLPESERDEVLNRLRQRLSTLKSLGPDEASAARVAPSHTRICLSPHPLQTLKTGSRRWMLQSRRRAGPCNRVCSCFGATAVVGMIAVALGIGLQHLS